MLLTTIGATKREEGMGVTLALLGSDMDGGSCSS